jgi:glycosyltransferase involved in cell wall biosynthesis
VEGIRAGIRTHCIDLFSQVVEQAPDIDFVFFLSEPRHLQEASQNYSAANVTCVRMPHGSSTYRLLVQLPALAKRYTLDLLHCQGIVPPFCPCPTAVTIHDTLVESHPEFFTKLFLLRAKPMRKRSARQSSLVFTVSEFSRRELIARYNVQSDHVVTIHNGVDCERFKTEGHPDAVLKQYGLECGGYLLTVGRLEPRKNHVRLLQAYARLPRPRPKLLIIGQRDFGYERIMEMIEADHLNNEVVLLEDIDDNMLPAFYRNALLFVYPSLAEGFGMPPLEAMASGVPVITSGNTALREVGGDAVVFVDPEDPESIAAAISTALSDPELRRDLVQRGLRRVREYNWADSAARVVRQYRGLQSGVASPRQSASAAMR